MGAPSKRAKKIRTADEFAPLLTRPPLKVPKGSGVPLTSWTLEQIFAARDDQLRGHFYRPAKMAEVMRTNDALAVAFENRLAPLRCTKVEMRAARGARGESISGEADALFGQSGIASTAETVGSIHACLVNHDVAFAQMIPQPRADGSRVDYALQSWPIEHVRWDAHERTFKTRVDMQDLPPGELSAGSEIPIVHGDGRWLIFQRYDVDPFKHAAILAAAIIWGSHGMAKRDWAKSSVSHGMAKVIAQLPQGVPLQDASGQTAEASAMMDLLEILMSGDSPFGIVPAGSSVNFMANASTNWQVFSELVADGNSAAARVYLGTDGTLGSKGDGPGVDISTLFGVATTKIQGDVAAISRGLQTMIEIWTAVNHGSSDLAPTRRYILPDADENAERAARATRRTAFFADIKAARENGFAITQDYVNSVAEVYDVEPPTLAEKSEPTTPSASREPAPASVLRRV